MKRSSAVLCLAVGFTLLGLGSSLPPGPPLQCYTCPDGSAESCEVVHECAGGKDSCIRLESAGKVYADCVAYSDCDFMLLAQNYEFSQFTFDCCQSSLCNTEKSPGPFERFKKFIKSLF
ncbi:CD59 glycoprotein-like [Lampris incognitus]|uniref:CD59 glycoprotein-like n=1 Tax=Lampris incognitus TaxID=2546036 RepID=UPI0024B5B15B|nr:CD59 glycoprotein-like [Lampris incognitus]